MRFLRTTVVVAAIAAGAVVVSGYSFLSPVQTWPDGSIVMHEQLGSDSISLIDGSANWNAAFEAGLAIWNSVLSRVQFTVMRNSSSGIADNNGINNVFFSSTIYGKSFGDSTLAVTTGWFNTRTNQRLEADIIFNTKISWNSYRGNQRGQIYDIRRVGIHESGHVLGLDHPDDHGQSVTAQMNSHASNLDTLAADDIAGAAALYPSSSVGGGTGAVINFPPRNESLDFRNQLEVKYRDGLHRSGSATTVDNEGDVVWTQEYLRYRVNKCDHTTATNNVMTEINGSAAPGVCGTASGGTVIFPPRNESLDFRQQLEVKYRDGLKRGPTTTSVDNEGDVVWTQEYLRYRVNGCSHGDAVAKVFQQIDGLGIQPVCR